VLKNEFEAGHRTEKGLFQPSWAITIMIDFVSYHGPAYYNSLSAAGMPTFF
jgi:hypothetical protein